MDLIRVAEIYPTFNGEVNYFGIGSPVIFLRLAGCHLRCYKTTKGTLCDTPDFLDSMSGEDLEIDRVIDKVNAIRNETDIRLICISGGDPLARPKDELSLLIRELLRLNYDISIETSGTISIQPILRYNSRYDFDDLSYYHQKGNLSFILDKKTNSAGIKTRSTVERDLSELNNFDYIKFVIDNRYDYEEMKEFVKDYGNLTFANIAVGCYWGSDITPFDLFNMLKRDKLTGRVVMNFQVHKMAIATDFTVETDSKQI